MIKTLSFQALGFAAVLFLGKAIGTDAAQPSQITMSAIIILAVVVVVVRHCLALSRKKMLADADEQSGKLEHHRGRHFQLAAYLFTLALFATCMWDRVVNGRILSKPDALIVLFLIAAVAYVVISLVLILQIGVNRAKAR